MPAQANHFLRYAPTKIKYGIDRYVGETERLFDVSLFFTHGSLWGYLHHQNLFYILQMLELRLQESEWLMAAVPACLNRRPYIEGSNPKLRDFAGAGITAAGE